MRVCKCGAFIKGRYCDKCNLSAAKRGYDYAWQKLRNRVLDKQPLCIDCLKQNRVRPAIEVHHVIPIADAPKLRLEESNLAPLCPDCHDARHA